MRENYTRVLIIVAIVSLLIVLAGLSGRGITIKVIFEYGLVRPINTILNSIRSSVKEVSKIISLFKSKIEIDSENIKLLEENELLKARLKMILDNFYENSQLKAQLKIKENYNFQYISSQVIGYDYLNNFLFLDVGSSSGVKKNMPVAFTNDGETIILVGIILDVGENSSRVMILNNPLFKVGVRILGKTSYEIAQGDGKGLVVYSILSNNPVNVNDIFVTSDVSEIFPQNLIVGKVSKVEQRNTIEKDIYIAPIIDLNTLFRVIVITKK